MNRCFHALASRVGIGQNLVVKAMGTALTGVSLHTLSAPRVNQAVSDVMRSCRCDSNVVRRLEEKLIQWQIAEQLGWPDTYAAEYLALTRLQADAFVTLDTQLARAAKGTVAIATYHDLLNH